MVHVTGTVHDVSDNPDRVEKVIVRAAEPRMHGTTYITEESAQFPVVDGVLDFEVLPGPCVVAFLRHHGATTYEKLLVPDVEEATFRECLDAAALAEEGTKSALEKVVRQIQEELGKAAPLLEEVRGLRTEVNASKTVVDGYVKDAQKSASSAASSESKAKTSETKADASATAAATSAGEARDHADRAEQATDLTSLRNEVTQQISDLVDGAPEDLDTIREIAEYAQANRGITDQLNAAIGNKSDKEHTHASADITDATDKLGRVSDYYTANKLVRTNADGQLTVYTSSVTADSSVANKNYVDIEVAKKADKGHKHKSSDVSDATAYSNGAPQAGQIMRLSDVGNFSLGPAPTLDTHLANKGYVDGEVAKKRTQDRWTYYGSTDSNVTNWVFTPIPLPGTPNMTDSNQRITPGVSSTWAIRLICTDRTREVDIWTPKGSTQGTGSCFIIVTLDDSDYITSYRYGAADDAKIVLEMTKLY